MTSELAAITSYGSHLGLLFQITDDFLDVTATAEDLGKTPGKDARSNKATYPALHGMEETRAAAIDSPSRRLRSPRSTRSPHRSPAPHRGLHPAPHWLRF